MLDGLFSVAPKTDRVCCLGLISADQPEEPRHGQETRWTDQRDQRCSDVALAVDPSPHLSALVSDGRHHPSRWACLQTSLAEVLLSSLFAG